ncbi:MAG: FmdB family zinc ribbon protein [Candidatus Binataceae bacterium]
MPIFEYKCDDCGTKFEKLVRRTADADAIRCPSCGTDHLTTEYSTFAAHAHHTSPKNCAQPAGGCGGGMCQSGMCGMNYN